MDIPLLIRNGVDTLRDIAGSVRTALEHYPVTGRSATGPIYATTPVPLLAFVEFVGETVTSLSGVEKLSSAKFTFMEPVAIAEGDRLKLNGVMMTVIKVGGPLDPLTSQPYAPEVWTGKA